MTDPTNEPLWRALWTGVPPLPTHRKRRILAHLPSNPRCRICLAPFEGVGGRLMGWLGIRPSAKNPNFCGICDGFARTHPGGAEVDLALVFADLRGSTSLAEQMSAQEFRRKIDGFYLAATEALIQADAFVDRLVGDQVVGLFMAGMAGPAYARRAVEAARRLVATVARRAELPVGAGVHTGTAYVGTMEGLAGVERDIAAVGDAVNTTARLASAAGPGEVLVSREAAAAAGIEVAGLEARQLTLKGKSQAQGVYVLPVAPE